MQESKQETAPQHNGAAELMRWLGENHPHMLRSARSWTCQTDFHQYMRGISGVPLEHFDSHGHACAAYLEALKRKQVAFWTKKEAKSPTPTLDKLEREHQANAEMIARDGPKRLPWCVCGNLAAMGTVHRTDGPCHALEETPGAKPPIAGLSRVSAQDHRVGGWGFVR